MYRAYVLCYVNKEDSKETVSRILIHKTGVIIVDILEEQPAVMIVVQARSRRKLAETTIKAMVSVENITESMVLMPTRDISQSNNKKSRVLTYNN